jgi:hypothetical protein
VPDYRPFTHAKAKAAALAKPASQPNSVSIDLEITNNQSKNGNAFKSQNTKKLKFFLLLFVHNKKVFLPSPYLSAISEVLRPDFIDARRGPL